MSSDKFGSCPNHRKAATEELIKGRDFAIQLEAMLRETSPGNHEQTSIMREVMATISRALLALDYRVKAEQLQHDDVDASKKWKIQSTQRGGYRRRSQPYPSKTTKSNSIDDGHAWRKYGQKEIHSTKFPRSYYRCTNKYDQDCKATRQVQRSEEDPSLFVITYFGEHTCRDPMEVLSSSCFQAEYGSRIIDFASHAKISAVAADGGYQRHELLFPKKDCCAEVVSSNPNPTPTSSDCFEFGGVVSEHRDTTTAGFEYQSSGENLEWDCIDIEQFDFRDMLNLEHDAFAMNLG